MDDQVRVVEVKDAPQPGVRVHHLSNGWFIREDPRKGSYRFKLYRPGQANPNDPKLIKTGNKLRMLLKFATEEHRKESS